jgi:hypothetical protein
MKQSIIILWIATLAVIVFLALSQRYTSGAGGSATFKIDRLTGEVSFIRWDGEELIVYEKYQKKGKITGKNMFGDILK